MLSTIDYAGSGFRIAEAVRQYSKYKVHHIIFFKSPRIFPYEHCVFDETTDANTLFDLQRLIYNADILHFKSDTPWENTWGYDKQVSSDSVFTKESRIRFNFTLPCGVPRVQTVSSSFFRRAIPRFKKVYDASSSEKLRITNIVKRTDARVALTPDLNTPLFKGVYIPAAMATKPSTWKYRKVPSIGHSPTGWRKKLLFEETLDVLRGKYAFTTDIIEQLPYLEAIRRKSRCTLFWEKVSPWSDAYGNSAIEAGMFGIPTLVYLGKVAQQQAKGLLNDMPYVRFSPELDKCKESLEGLLKMSKSDLTDLSHRTKEWTEKVHGYENVGTRYAEIYDSLLK